MSTMVNEVYDALKSAGADDDKARAAATALAQPTHAKRVDGDLRLHRWMLAVILVIQIATLWRVFT